MTDDEIKQIYASAPTSKVDFEVVELSASWFSKSYYLQREFIDDVSVTIETGETVVAQYVPMSLGKSSSNADLTYERSIVIQWVNDVIAQESSNRDPETHAGELPSFTSRMFIRYRDGTISAQRGAPITLPVRKQTRDYLGTTLSVSAQPANTKATGEIATPTRIPMLRGFL